MCEDDKTTEEDEKLLCEEDKSTEKDDETCNDDKYLNEYKEAASVSRFESALMFGQLTVYLATSGATLKAVTAPDLENHWGVLLAVIGFVLSCAFCIITHRAADFHHTAERRARELEIKLNFRVHTIVPPRKWGLSATNAVVFICSAGIVLWAIIFGFLVGRWNCSC